MACERPERQDMSKVPFRISPMLATLVDAPFRRTDWVFEEKYDGVRILAYKEDSDVFLISRSAINRTSKYPEIASAIQKLKSPALALDGEIVVFDSKSVSRFQLLQQRKGQPRYAIFDCMYADGRDLRKKTLAQRRGALQRLIKPSPPLLLAKRLAADGLKAFEIASRRGLEGVIGKNLSSAYTEGRSTEWLKVKVNQEEEFVIGGFTEPAGSRRYFGALLLGEYARDQLRYVGKVGTGFNDETLRSLHQKLRALARARSPFSKEVSERGAKFVAAKLVAQISFTERTKDGKLRHPVYLGLRDDKSAREVTHQKGM